MLSAVLAVAFAVPRPASVPPEGLRRTEETPSGESSAQNDCDEHAVAHAQKPTTPEVWQEENGVRYCFLTYKRT